MANISGRHTSFNTKLNANDSTAKERVGTLRPVDERMFIYVHAEEAFTVGQTAQLASHEIADADVDAWDATTRKLTATGDFAGVKLAGAYIFFNAGTGISQMARVTGNSDDVVVLENYLDTSKTGNNVFEPDETAPDATTDYVLFSPVDARKGDAGVATRVGGVAQDALTADNYGWLQVRGTALGLIDDSDSDLIVGSGLVNSATTEGSMEGLATATAAEIPLSFGYSLISEADAPVADDVVPINLTII